MTTCKRTRILPLLTAIVLLLTMLFIPAGTAGADHDPFRDVPQGKWYTEAVLYCYEQGYVSGYEDGTFRPDGDLTRAEMAVIMDRMLDLTEIDHRSFADVKSGKWYTDAVLRCAKAGVMSGYGNGSFGTADRLTREQGTLILARAFDVPADTGRTSFADDGSISGWAVGAVKAMAARGFVRGTGGNRFEPARTLTRAQMCQILYAARTDPGQDDPSGELELVFLDVGQGDAALVTCGGHSMLIDGGAPGQSSKVYSVLKNRGISSLDYIVATHPHEDHMGGLAGALNAVSVQTALSPVEEYDSTVFASFKKYLSAQGVSITVPKAGEVYPLGDARITILGLGDTSSINNMSIVLRIDCGAFSALFSGDAEYGAEKNILAARTDLKSTVLKVGHHGSETSTCYEWLYRIEPETAVISVGKNNSYGHPSEGVLSRLRDAGVTVCRTDLQGDVLIRGSADGTYTVEVDRNADADTGGAEAVSPETGTYILNTSTMKFHRPDCASAARIADANRREWEGSREELIRRGYSPCGSCAP